MDTYKLHSFKDGFRRTPSLMKEMYRTLSPERVLVVWGLVFISIVLVFSALIAFNSRFLITVPGYGGTINEGIMGTPRYINPVLATSEQDQDLTSLVYAGLMKKDSSGNDVLDMASSIEESEDKLHYRVIIRSDAHFHDGTPVTADDVIYTINLIQNPNIKSPHRVEWEGVTMEKISDTELVFSLKKSFPLFYDNLTIGILPKHVWKSLTDEQFSLSDYNIHAIGSGPYEIDSIKTVSGIPQTFTLVAHKKYTLGRPYIDTIRITTYQNEKYLVQAFQDGEVDRIHGISLDSVASLGVPAGDIHTSLLPRTFSVFFNTAKASSPLTDKSVRQALALSVDKNAIVHTVLHDYGKALDGPYPFDESTATSTYDVEEARKLLQGSKTYKASPNITVTLATANTDEMKKVATMIKEYWAAIGVETNIEVYEVADLNQSVIKDRDFQALLFGSIIETPSDLYAFWNSSQRTYPGLNITGYVSSKLDKNLDVLRASDDPSDRATAYNAIKTELIDEAPSIPLYAPDLIYITKDKAATVLPIISFNNSSRFTLVEDWHRYTEHVWPKTYSKELVQAVENIIH